MTTFSSSQLATARRLCALADAGGTIQANDLVKVFPDPRNHRAMTVREAWSIALPGVDCDALAEALWA